MTEILKAGEYVLKADIANWIIAICAFFALFATLHIGKRQVEASEATVNRQIILKWIEDFRGKISMLVTGSIAMSGIFKFPERFNESDRLALIDNVAQAKSNIQLLLDVKEASHEKLRGLLSKFVEHSFAAIKDQGAVEPMKSLSVDVMNLSKVIIDQKMVLVRAGKLEASKKNRAEMDVYYNSWPEKVECDKEAGTKAS